MAKLRLRKLLRGEAVTAIDALIALAQGPIKVTDPAGQLLAGSADAPDEPQQTLELEGRVLGRVHGGAGSDAIVAILKHLASREMEKVQLARETLGRYKELTLLYGMSDQLSRLFEADDVARTVVEETQRAVSGDSCALYKHDQRTDRLVALARSSEIEPAVLPALSGVEGRVLSTGQAEFVEHVDTDMRRGPLDKSRCLICAPIRSGERVVGVLRVTQEVSGRWSSGDLKLVSSIAAQAATALQGAELYRTRMREVALKHHLQRYVSPYLLQVATDNGEEEPGQLALLFCDLSWAEESATAPVDVVLHREGRLTRAVSVMLEHGAVVDLPQGDMILAAIHDTTPGQAARRAVSAAFELVAALARFSHASGQPDTAGIGVTSIDLGTADKGLVAEALNATALLQSASGGRVLVDYAVAEALGQRHHPTEVSGVELPGIRNHVYEVRP